MNGDMKNRFSRNSIVSQSSMGSQRSQSLNINDIMGFGNQWKPPMSQSLKANKHVKYVIMREARTYEKEIQKRKE